MPVIQIEGGALDKEKKRQMVQAISHAAAQAYDLPVEKIIVLVRETSADNVGVGGVLLSDR